MFERHKPMIERVRLQLRFVWRWAQRPNRFPNWTVWLVLALSCANAAKAVFFTT